MPELPDVENFRRYFARHALHQSIASVHVNDRRSLRGSPQGLARAVKHHSFTRTRRHGKHLLVPLDRGVGWLAMHFGMTGYLVYFDEDDDRPKFDRVQFDFTNGHRLAYVDARLGELSKSEDLARYVL